ncbi:hypothetical protein JOC86_002696 [Bacillus pakistanensis]|uniref:Uncharacterized protein n=1 Tax=Rossellomorea pakistanensis TaxID=992288 RepID=A0ABS2NE73_9BACI|nr:hypothetical protein [Bacillus pakistanensis]MBM7586154.1 hypothetical protein [Bacillus pakistanensis]
MKEKKYFDQEATEANMEIQEKFYENNEKLSEDSPPSYIGNGTPSIKITGNDE